MKKQENWFNRLFKAFKYVSNSVEVGDYGIYSDELEIYTSNKDNDTIKHRYSAKVKVIGVYENLVEIILADDIRVSDFVSTDMHKLITKNFPRFTHPSSVKWELKNKTNN